MKKILVSFIILFCFSVTGCTNTNDEDDDILKEDITIHQNDNPGRYFNDPDDVIDVHSFNGYQCVDTSISYDEDSDTYSCVVKFKKIIK